METTEENNPNPFLHVLKLTEEDNPPPCILCHDDTKGGSGRNPELVIRKESFREFQVDTNGEGDKGHKYQHDTLLFVSL